MSGIQPLEPCLPSVHTEHAQQSLPPNSGLSACPLPSPHCPTPTADLLQQNWELQAFCRQHGIQFQAYSSLGGQWLAQSQVRRCGLLRFADCKGVSRCKVLGKPGCAASQCTCMPLDQLAGCLVISS